MKMLLANAKPRTLAALTVALFLLLATTASATIRFAGPGGTGNAPCTNRLKPCSIAGAVGAHLPDTEDEVVLLPGEYSDAAGDLGASGTVALPGGIHVHGEVGGRLPRISLTSSRKAFIVNLGAEVSLLSFRSDVKFGSAFQMPRSGGFVHNVVATTSGESAITCEVDDGHILDSACLATGSAGTALGHSILATPQPTSPELVNVTASATGPASVGIAFGAFDGARYRVSGIAVIASGVSRDVLAVTNAGSEASIDLRSSNFSNVLEVGPEARISAPAVLDEPLFTADGYHQRLSSPTVDRGTLGILFFGKDDVDGQKRVIGDSVDIGADELAERTSVEVACGPQPTPFPGTSTCVGTTADALPNGLPMVGTLVFTLLPKPPFSAADIGALSNGGRCTLSTIEPITRAQCSVTFTPGKAGPGAYTVAVSYAGDRIHDSSESSTEITVVRAPDAGGGPGGGGSGGTPPVAGPQPAPATKLTKKPRKSSTRPLALFRFASDQTGSSFECKVDRKRFRKCRSPFKARTKPGSHTFRVRAVNGAGLADPSPALFRWRVLAS
jgi:hypothetical protein